jgi:hypothetical protein
MLGCGHVYGSVPTPCIFTIGFTFACCHASSSTTPTLSWNRKIKPSGISHGISAHGQRAKSQNRYVGDGRKIDVPEADVTECDHTPWAICKASGESWGTQAVSNAVPYADHRRWTIKKKKKRNKKSPGRVTWGVEDANKRKLPGHVCEQEHHRWRWFVSHRENCTIIFEVSRKQ